MDLDALERRLNGISKKLEDEEESFKKLVIHVAEKDETKESYDILYDTLSEDEKGYHRANEAYKKYISQYSKEYIVFFIEIRIKIHMRTLRLIFYASFYIIKRYNFYIFFI